MRLFLISWAYTMKGRNLLATPAVTGGESGLCLAVRCRGFVFEYEEKSKRGEG